MQISTYAYVVNTSTPGDLCVKVGREFCDFLCKTLCVCVHVYVRAWLCVCYGMHGEVKGQALRQFSPSILFDAGCLLLFTSVYTHRLADPPASRSSPVLTSRLCRSPEAQLPALQPLAVHGFWRFELRSAGLHSRHLPTEPPPQSCK